MRKTIQPVVKLNDGTSVVRPDPLPPAEERQVEWWRVVPLLVKGIKNGGDRSNEASKILQKLASHGDELARRETLADALFHAFRNSRAVDAMWENMKASASPRERAVQLPEKMQALFEALRALALGSYREEDSEDLYRFFEAFGTLLIKHAPQEAIGEDHRELCDIRRQQRFTTGAGWTRDKGYGPRDYQPPREWQVDYQYETKTGLYSPERTALQAEHSKAMAAYDAARLARKKEIQTEKEAAAARKAAREAKTRKE